MGYRGKVEEIERLLIEGRQAIGEMSSRDLLIAGAALYAGEGDKRDGAVGFTNSDPRMIALFLRWLRECFEIDESRLRVSLYLHEGLDLVEATHFWSCLTGIPTSQFNQPYRARADPSIRTARHTRCCAKVRYGSASTHRSIMGLVAALLP